MKRIPAWVIGLSGALIVLLSTAIGSQWWWTLDAKIQGMQKDRAELGSKITELWDSHKLADARSASADQFLGLLLIGGEGTQDFFLKQINIHLRGSLLAMMAATGKSVPDEPPPEVQQLSVRLLKGDLKAYAKFKSNTDSLRLESQEKINALGKERYQIEEKIKSFESNGKVLQMLSVGLNIFGLILVMLKDLPVWKRHNNGHETSPP